MAPLPYDVILQIDRDIHTIMNEAPLWMRDENYILDPSAPSWADWQRKAYLASISESLKKQHTNISSQLSASHKVSCQYTQYRAYANYYQVIVIHRPYLGRAFRGDQRYIRSREVRRH